MFVFEDGDQHFFELATTLNLGAKWLFEQISLTRRERWFRSNFPLAVQPFDFNRSKFFWSRSAVHGIRFKRFLYPFVIRSHTVRSTVRTDTVRNVFAWEVTFLVLSWVWDEEKILSSHEELNLRHLDSMLWCSTTEPQRLYSELGLLQTSYDVNPAHC